MKASLRTKMQFARAMKQLLITIPMEKINVTQLSEMCNLHRKSFYYHFIDKYDLLNWILKSEVIGPLQEESHEGLYDALTKIIYRINEERSFYRAAFRMERANSFANTFTNSFHDFFIEQMRYFVEKYHLRRFAFNDAVTKKKQTEFYLDSLSGAIMANIQQWLLEHQEMDVEEYIALLTSTKPF